ncbi:MAG: hypothetical protein ACR2NV_01110 [Thermoleophilaceae bacterium]
MSPRADPELDDLIAGITVDAHDEDEALTGFENAFDEADCLPCPGSAIGEDIEILSISTSNGRQELIATCQRASRHHQIALLDIDINVDQPASRLLAAYRRWTGTESSTT